MKSYSVNKTFPWQGGITDKVASVMKMFGLNVDRLKTGYPAHQCKVKLKAGDICYITGGSGAGKSVLLNELYALADDGDKIRLEDIPLDADKTLIDCIECGFFEGLRILSKAGLSDVFAVLNTPRQLSEGQKYRYRLARALVSNKNMIFADEFCSNLDRITAAVIAHNIRMFASKANKTFVLASSHDDLLCDLGPDVVVIKHFARETEVIYRDKRAGGC